MKEDQWFCIYCDEVHYVGQTCGAIPTSEASNLEEQIASTTINGIVTYTISFEACDSSTEEVLAMLSEMEEVIAKRGYYLHDSTHEVELD